jgi:hypothetical protein
LLELAGRPSAPDRHLLDYLSVLHQFAHLLLSSKLQRSLYRHLAPRSQILPTLPIRRTQIEDLRLDARREVLMLALGLMQTPQSIETHIARRRIRYNFLLRDMDYAPQAYVRWVQALPHKRRGPPRHPVQAS